MNRGIVFMLVGIVLLATGSAGLGYSMAKKKYTNTIASYKGLDEARGKQTKVTVINEAKQNPIGFFDGGTGSDASTSNGFSGSVSHESA